MTRSITKTVTQTRTLTVTITEEMLDDVRRGQGAYPHSGSNHCANDGYYWKSLKEKYSDAELIEASRIVARESELLHQAGEQIIADSLEPTKSPQEIVTHSAVLSVAADLDAAGEVQIEQLQQEHEAHRTTKEEGEASNTLRGWHYCNEHQGNRSLYDPKNCAVCHLHTQVEKLRDRIRAKLK